MSTSALEGLTKKQRQVHDMLGEGQEPNDIARRMKVTPSAVYAHMRNIRKAGVALASEQPVTVASSPEPDAPSPSPEPDPPEAAANGTPSPEAALRAALQGGERRAAEIEHEVIALSQERANIMEQNEKYLTALDALT